MGDAAGSYRLCERECPPSSWTTALLEEASSLGPKTGKRYQRIVIWCLSVDGNGIMKEEEFVENILDPLYEISSALL